MNRAIVFGIAIFFAVVGIALMGGDNQVLAGHGCNGCDGGCGGGCDGGYCHGGGGCMGDCDGGCHGRRRGGLFHRHRRGNGCHGDSHCCGPVAPPACCGCDGGYIPADDMGPPPGDLEGPPPAPEGDDAPEAPQARARSFRKVFFRR